jgi:hypothetical protein
MQAVYRASERRALRVFRWPRTTHRQVSRADPQLPLRLRLRELAAVRVAYGYRRLHVLLRRIEDCSIPNGFDLKQNYPNPFNASTTIKYGLPKSTEVRLSVFDVLGKEVSLLVNERKDAGRYEVKFEASGFASGVYLYWLQAGGFVQSHKLLLLR